MNRRAFIHTLTIAAVTPALAAEAQPTPKISRLGVLTGFTGSLPSGGPQNGLPQRLHELDRMEGQDLVFEWRWSDGFAERLPELAAELVRIKVDVIVATDNPAIAAAQKATPTIPIVMVLAADPVGTGFVRSLGRPGGNVTGLSFQASELQPKALQFLKEAVPTASRMAILWDPTEPGRRAQAREAEVAARALGLEVELVEVRMSAELDGAFATIARKKPNAVLVQPSQMIFAHRTRIAELAAKSRLPSTAVSQWWPEAGGFMSYGPNYLDLWRRAADYVDRILRGAKASDLPVEQPTKFDLIINLKTAKAVGLTIPQSLVLRADRIIE